MSAKAVPKTLHQVRNVVYVFAAFAGVQRGFREKTANDNLWKEHQRHVRQQNIERQHAAHALEEMKRDAQLERTVPEAVPGELHDIYKTFAK